MRQVEWVRSALRIVGVILAGFALPGLVNIIPSLMNAFLLQAGTPGSNGGQNILLSYVFWTLAAFSQFLFGLYLIFGGTWVYRLCVRDVPWMCVYCGYDLRGGTGNKCPECGGAASSSESVSKGSNA